MTVIHVLKFEIHEEKENHIIFYFGWQFKVF